ncbi:MAG: ESPR-type extended signal peptide-containing protein, partial [Marinobacterium sp.]
MNHAYRVVWNQALQVWMAVAEISRRKGKTKASVLLSGLLLGASPASAVEETFTAASGNWSDGGNWADGSAPVSGTDLQLNFEYVDYDNGYESIHDIGDLTVNRLSFSTSNPVFPFIDVDAASVDDKLTFAGVNATIDMSSPSEASFEVYINPEVVLDSTLRVAGSDSTSNNTVLVAGGISGGGGLTVSEGVAVHLAANDSGLYTGDTTIEAGGILVNAWRTPNALSAASRHIVNGELRLLESGAIGGLEGSGQVTIDNGKSLEVRALNTDSVFSGVISDYSDSGSLNKTGSGTLTLTGANTYTGGTTISNGTLAVRNGGSI